MNIDDEFYNELLDITRDFVLRNKVNPNTVNVSVDTFCRITGSNTTRYQPAYINEDGRDEYMGMWLVITYQRNTYVSLN